MDESAHPRAAHPPTLLFDGDCGFCTTSARWAERHMTSATTAVVPWQEADLEAFGVTAEQCDESVQFITKVGAVSSGAAAIAALLRERRRPWAWLGSVLTLPVVRQLAAVVYRVVSENRHRLPGGTPACRADSGTEHATARHRSENSAANR